MAKQPAEIRDAVEEIEKPFGSAVSRGDPNADTMTLRNRQAILQDMIQSRLDYRLMVNPLFTNKIAVPPVTLAHYINERAANLRNDLMLHLEPIGELKRDETAADKMEVAEAHDLIMLDPHGFLREAIHMAQVKDMFFAGLLEARDFVMPEQGRGEADGDYARRVERARAGFFPFQVRHLHPQTVAWTEHDRTPTSAVARYKLPIIDLLERYTDGRREHIEKLTRIHSEHYGWLVVDEAQLRTGAIDYFSQTVEVVMYIDKGKICHYVDCEASKLKDKSQKYRGIGEEEYDNYFGGVPLHIAEGVYYPHEEIAYRRAPLLVSLINAMHSQAIILSNWASQVANGGWPTVDIPPEVQVAYINADKEMPGVEMKYDPATGLPIPLQFGLNYASMPVDPSADKLFGVFQQWEAKTSPNSVLFDPDAAQRLGSIPSTTVLAQLSENNKMAGWAERSEKNVWSGVLDQIWNYRRAKLNSHRKKGEPKSDADWNTVFTATGQEKVLGKTINRGAAYEITAQEMDGEYTRVLQTVDNSDASRSARRREAMERKAAGAILEREYLELMGIENVSEFVTKHNAEEMFKLEAPAILTEARQRRLMFISARDGRDPEELLMLAGVQPQYVGGQGEQDIGSTYRMGSPHVDGVGSGSAARSVT